jgi:hypothetical protein
MKLGSKIQKYAKLQLFKESHKYQQLSGSIHNISGFWDDRTPAVGNVMMQHRL